MVNGDYAAIHYLKMKGLAVRPVKYESTNIDLGWQINTPNYSMTFRLEEGVLLICNILGMGPRNGLSTAVKPIMHLWQGLLDDFPEINEIKGLISAFGSYQERIEREKMVSLFEEKGARLSIIQGERWLSYRK
jgi:hypothetical protein